MATTIIITIYLCVTKSDRLIPVYQMGAQNKANLVPKVI